MPQSDSLSRSPRFFRCSPAARLVLAFSALCFLSAMPSLASAEESPLAWKGDFRLRADHSRAQDRPAQIRNRLRLRVGATADVAESLTATFRLATVGSSQESVTSSDQTFDDGSSKKPIWLDQAFLKWTAAGDLHLLAGKFAMPYSIAGGNDMTWDTDLTFEGAVARWSHELSAIQLIANAGAYWLNERTNTGTDPGPDILLVGSQVGAAFKTASTTFKATTTLHTFAHIAESPVLGRGARGNSTSPSNPGRYRHDFVPLQVGLEATNDKLGPRLVGYLEAAKNTAIARQGDAWIAGLEISDGIENPGGWQVNYNYRVIESDALVGALNDSDFEAGADVRYHKWVTSYRVTKAVTASLSAFIGETSVSTTARDFNRALLDARVDF